MSDDDAAQRIRALEDGLEQPLPLEYKQFLLMHEEAIVGSRVLLYDVHSLMERNETFETKLYCPGYLAIGDDSGGRALVIPLGEPWGSVYSVDHGDMTPRGLRLVTRSFAEWVRNQCPLDTL
jgi:hypothetical protein